MPRYRIYVGPSAVKESAEKLAEAGFLDVIAGTEHVLASADIDTDVPHQVAATLGYVPLSVQKVSE